jgi:hypothetical protein
MTTYQVYAKHFTAAIICHRGRCVQAAPILAWAAAKTETFLLRYFEKKGWRYVIVPTKQ